eukprot:scpid36838/ scgid19228/ Saposin-C; Co-beta-glucosidase; Glucosylceramidase activator; Sphingolipid activator protein 2
MLGRSIFLMLAAVFLLLALPLGTMAQERPAQVEPNEGKQAKEVDFNLGASNTTCTLCEFVMSIIQGQISANSSQADIIKLLDNFCEKFMPVTIKQECEDFVADYGNAIIQLIDQKIDPQLVCREIKLCPHEQQIGRKQQRKSVSVN